MTGAARWDGDGLKRTAFVRLTEQRLSVLIHYAFAADRVIELPKTAIGSVRGRPASVDIPWLDAEGQEHVLALTNWRGRYGKPFPTVDCQALRAALTLQ